MAEVFAGIDLGGTTLVVALAGADGEVVVEKSIPTESHRGPQAVLQSAAELVNDLAKSAGARVAAAGMGVPGLADHPLTPLFVWLLIGGFAIKAGLFPVHMWLPVAHPIAPSSASALLSGVMIKAGAYGVIRVIYGVFGMSVINAPAMGTLLMRCFDFTISFE